MTLEAGTSREALWGAKEELNDLVTFLETWNGGRTLGGADEPLGGTEGLHIVG